VLKWRGSVKEVISEKKRGGHQLFKRAKWKGEKLMQPVPSPLLVYTAVLLH